MQLIKQIYQQEFDSFAEVLLISLGVIFFIALVLLCLTLIKRYNGIQKLKKKEDIEHRLEPVLFEYLFNAIEMPVFENQSRLFQKIAIKLIKNLHQNYSGIYQKKLEDLYVSQGLVNYSLLKLKSDDWSDKVEAIRDLSTLNYKEALPKIQALMFSNHHLVQMEALIGIIRLAGLEELAKYKNTSLYLNDWVQSNLLYAIKKYHLEMPANMELLLESKNDTFLIFTIRLMRYFQFAYHQTHLHALKEKTTNNRLRVEIENHLKNQLTN